VPGITTADDSGFASLIISVFRDLLSRYPDASTVQLCGQIFFNELEPLRGAYYKLLDGKTTPDGRPLVGPATCFISHAWAYDFSVIVDAVLQYEATHPNTYYWFDLFVNNQHDTTAKPHDWWSTTFKR
jgi:hypothetical protein